MYHRSQRPDPRPADALTDTGRPADTAGVGRVRPRNTQELLTIALRMAASGLEFAAMIILARSLAPAAFGQLSAAVVVVRLLAMFCDSGAAFSGTRDVARFGWDSSPIWWWQGRRQRRSLVVAVGYAALASAVGHPELALLAVVLVARGANRDWIGMGRRRSLAGAGPTLVGSAVVAVGAPLVGSVGQAALLMAGGSAAWIVASTLANTSPSGGDGAVSDTHPSVRRRPTFDHAMHRLRPRAADWALIALFADQVIQSFDIVLLAALRSTDEAGIYSAVYRIPNALLLLTGLAVTTSVPRVVGQLLDGVPVADLRRFCDRLGWLLGAVVAVFAVTAVGLVEPMFGAAYRDGRLPLLLLMVATTFNIASAPFRALQLTTGRDREVATVAVLNGLATVGLGLVLIPRAGMTAAAGVTAGAQLVFLAYFVAATRDDARWSGRAAEAVAISRSR